MLEFYQWAAEHFLDFVAMTVVLVIGGDVLIEHWRKK